MVAESLDLVNRLLSNIFLEGYVPGNHVPAEHEFLPNHDAEFIADIVEIIGLIVTSAPFTNHIHVRVASGLEYVAMYLRSYTVRKAVKRNNIRAFAKYRNAIYNKLETLPPLIGNAAEL